MNKPIYLDSFKTYHFMISSDNNYQGILPTQASISSLQLSYDFDKKRGNISFEVNINETLNLLTTSIPNELVFDKNLTKVYDSKLNRVELDNSEILKHFKDDQDFEIKPITKNNFFIEAVFYQDLNESFYPNGVFSLASSFYNTDYSTHAEPNFYEDEVIGFNLGENYVCGQSGCILEIFTEPKNDNINSFFIDKKMSIFNKKHDEDDPRVIRFTLNTMKANVENMNRIWEGIFIGLIISLITLLGMIIL